LKLGQLHGARGYPDACIASGAFAHRENRSAVPFAL
jgi:hypothetical protein